MISPNQKERASWSPNESYWNRPVQPTEGRQTAVRLPGGPAQRSQSRMPGGVGGVAGAILPSRPDSLFSLVFPRQILENFPGQKFVDFTVSGNRLGLASPRIVINVMPPPMPQKRASGIFEFRDQIASLHATSSSSSFLIPGISSALKV